MSDLTNALSNLYKQQTHESEMTFFRTLRESIENKTLVAVPVIKHGAMVECCIFEKRGQKHAIMFSDESRISHRFGDDKIIKVDIPTLIKALYYDPHLEGLSIDPGSPDSICIARRSLPDITGIPDPRRKPKNWGHGIPKYYPRDLMSKEEIFDFAMQIIRDYEMLRNGYEIIDEYASQSLSPNFISMKNGQKYYVTVKADIAPNIPKLTLQEKINVQTIARRDNAVACFASVSFGSTDMERFNAGLALCGDGFYTRYTGLENLNVSSQNKGPMLSILTVLCKSYSTGDFSPLFPLLAENIELHSMWVLKPLKGKRSVVEYFIGKGETVKRTNSFPECHIVQLEGNMNAISSKNIKVNGESKAGSVGLWYENGKYCMLMTQKLAQGNASGIVDLTLNNEGMITKINICIPELFRFKLTNFFTPNL